MEKELIRLEKKIFTVLRDIKNKKVTPKDSGIGVLINLLKSYDEPLYERILREYKNILAELKN